MLLTCVGWLIWARYLFVLNFALLHCTLDLDLIWKIGSDADNEALALFEVVPFSISPFHLLSVWSLWATLQSGTEVQSNAETSELPKAPIWKLTNIVKA